MNIIFFSKRIVARTLATKQRNIFFLNNDIFLPEIPNTSKFSLHENIIFLSFLNIPTIHFYDNDEYFLVYLWIQVLQ